MQSKGRSVPPDEDRGPRNKALSVYLSEEEHEGLQEISGNLGFPSKSAMIVYIIESLDKGGYSGFSFMKLGHNFSKLIEKSGKGHIDIPMPKFIRKTKTTKRKKNT